MTEVFIYDHVRTPRGRGKKDGALHEVPSVRLAAKTLEAIRDRNGLDTATVDDIITSLLRRWAHPAADVTGPPCPGNPGSVRFLTRQARRETGPTTLLSGHHPTMRDRRRGQDA